ncbi:hypothetical protein ACQCN2_18110 [Brevibacillus ginsengisoli]|uniref:hypothetical protein n=1 Tax=Brevibacillus ginsengisoli TaxID=363854 RepID=UPI003CEE638F
MNKRKAFIFLLVLSLFISTLHWGNFEKAEAATQPVKVEDIQKLLNGWSRIAVGGSLKDNSKNIVFEKKEIVNKKLYAHLLSLRSYKVTNESFDTGIKNYIQLNQQQHIQLKIKKHTNALFEAVSADSREYTYVYVVKTNNEYTVNEISLVKWNDGWRFGVGYQMTLNPAIVKAVDKLAPQLMQEFLQYQFIDSQTLDTTYKTMSKQKDWVLVNTRITGNTQFEYLANAVERSYEKVNSNGKYGINVEKRVLTQKEFTEVLRRYKSISTPKLMSTYVKAYELKGMGPEGDDKYGYFSPTRIIFVQKKGTNTIDYYRILSSAYDAKGMGKDESIGEWSIDDTKEINRVLETIVDGLVKAP